MPPVKIDYVVSFSSEDPEHPANNLLSSEVKSKWLCCAGESSCSVVLQLQSACKIDSITIGAYHVALLEVLVGLSEKPNDPFQVLVPSCVLLSPGASRRGEGVECVRSFGAAQLASAPAQRRWDRVRLVCSQPYNKHCKYGLAFVHISSAEGAGAAGAGAAAPRRALWLDADAGSDDEFRPGELFARHRRSQPADAQIRQASSQALKNIPDASTELTKTPIAKNSGMGQTHRAERGAGQGAGRAAGQAAGQGAGQAAGQGAGQGAGRAAGQAAGQGAERAADRRRESLLYTADDDEPHAKIDGVLQRHHETSERRATPDTRADKHQQNKKKTIHNDHSGSKNKLINSRSDGDQANGEARRVRGDAEADKLTHRDNTTPLKTHSERKASSTDSDRAPESQTKRKRSGENHPDLGPVCESLDQVLAGAAVALSGYVNPERAALRAAALEMGARYLRDWDPTCTHLICAFPNTPKLRALRAARAATAAVDGAWLAQCRARRRRLPWRWFAVEPRQRQPAPDLDRLSPRSPREHDSEGDTDDEIEKVLKHQGKKPRNSSPDRADRDLADAPSEHDQSDRQSRPGGAAAADADADASRDSDVAFVRDERVQAQISLQSDSDATDEDERGQHPDSVAITKELPAPWAGRAFALSARLPARDAALLARYIRAYGGLVLQEHELLEDSSVTYVVEDGGGGGGAAGGGGARRVSPAWVWRRLARA